MLVQLDSVLAVFELSQGQGHSSSSPVAKMHALEGGGLSQAKSQGPIEARSSKGPTAGAGSWGGPRGVAIPSLPVRGLADPCKLPCGTRDGAPG